MMSSLKLGHLQKTYEFLTQLNSERIAEFTEKSEDIALLDFSSASIIFSQFNNGKEAYHRFLQSIQFDLTSKENQELQAVISALVFRQTDIEFGKANLNCESQQYSTLMQFLSHKLSSELGVALLSNQSLGNSKLLSFCVKESSVGRFTLPFDLAINLALYSIAFDNLQQNELVAFFAALKIEEEVPKLLSNSKRIETTSVLLDFLKDSTIQLDEKAFLKDQKIALQLNKLNNTSRTFNRTLKAWEELPKFIKKTNPSQMRIMDIYSRLCDGDRDTARQLAENIEKLPEPLSRIIFQDPSQNTAQNLEETPPNLTSLTNRFLRNFELTSKCHNVNGVLLLRKSQMQKKRKTKNKKLAKATSEYKGDPERWIPIHLRRNNTLPKTKKNSAKLKYKENIMQGVATADLVDDQLDFTKLNVDGDTKLAKKVTIPLKVTRRKKTTKRR
ncbi:MAG: hypothetical protein MHMPM18_000259 [Marteilia pararefringens]